MSKKTTPKAVKRSPQDILAEFVRVDVALKTLTARKKSLESELDIAAFVLKKGSAVTERMSAFDPATVIDGKPYEVTTTEKGGGKELDEAAVLDLLKTKYPALYSSVVDLEPVLNGDRFAAAVSADEKLAEATKKCMVEKKVSYTVAVRVKKSRKDGAEDDASE